MNELLQEFCDSRGVTLRVDRTAGVIRGIKILGLHSRNGREYSPEALARAVALYEGAKVNVNHPKGHPLAPRDYQERIGVIRNPQHRAGEGLFADFHFNPKHYLSEQLMWDAEHAPENVGFSHNVQARTSRRGEALVVEEILRVHSVDLVADPATTRGLFESEAVAVPPPADETADQGVVGDGEEHVGASEAAEKLCRKQTEEIARLRAELDRFRARQAADERRSTLRALLAEYRLPDVDAADPAAKAIVSEAFVREVLTSPDERSMRRLVEARARLVSGVKKWTSDTSPPCGRPMSRDQVPIDAPRVDDARSFARVIRG